MSSYSAKELRVSEENAISDLDHPGWYRWWAPVELCRRLLGPHAVKVLPHLKIGTDDLQDYRLVYVGIAAKESLYDRVVTWHIRQTHTHTNISRGFLSTFRQTISSLEAGSQAAEAKTNAVIDQLRVELFPVQMRIRDDVTKKHLEAAEDAQLNSCMIPFNIKGNQNETLHDFLGYLRGMRKMGKAQGLKEIKRG